jgi:hypothetical protein
MCQSTEAYWQPEIAAIKAEKALERRLAEDAMFEKAFAKLQ